MWSLRSLTWPLCCQDILISHFSGENFISNHLQSRVNSTSSSHPLTCYSDCVTLDQFFNPITLLISQRETVKTQGSDKPIFLFILFWFTAQFVKLNFIPKMLQSLLGFRCLSCDILVYYSFPLLARRNDEPSKRKRDEELELSILLAMNMRTERLIRQSCHSLDPQISLSWRASNRIRILHDITRKSSLHTLSHSKGDGIEFSWETLGDEFLWGRWVLCACCRFVAGCIIIR